MAGQITRGRLGQQKIDLYVQIRTMKAHLLRLACVPKGALSDAMP
nr:phosphatidylinositol/phosphatidylcholine transfer protein SFH13-like [Ipomoea batatas]GMC60623.1 phosphatidylinositol/phosphatidylcholine transfer protein SFH13-like [Ipomoea batatas]